MQKHYVINEQFNHIQKNIIDINKEFALSNKTIHQARNQLKIITIENIEYVVKSFKIPHLINQFIYSFFKDSKAKKSYNYSVKIGDFTPTPVAYIEFYSMFLLKRSYFISEEFNYDFTIREPLIDKNFKDRENIFKAFAKFTLELHNANIFHNDYSPGNILIKKSAHRYIFKIVDINRMGFFKLNESHRAKNFSKLWASDDILKIIALEYQNNYSTNKNFIDKVLYYSNRNKRNKNFKKWLKGKEIND